MAKTPFYVKTKPLTRTDELRDQLEELESMIGRLSYSLGKEALSIPALFDVVSVSLDSFHAEGQSLRAEEARLQTASARFSGKANVFLREIGGSRVLQDARRVRQPDPEQWWWYVDELVTGRRRRRLRRLLQLGAGVVLVLVVLAILYQRFLAPDPATRERLRRQTNAENLALQGDVAGALGEVDGALAIAPDDANLLALKGVLHQVLGQDVFADEAYAAAEQAYADAESFLLARARAYLLLDQAEAALVDAQAVVELNPESAAGYMLMGRAYERLEDYLEAVLAYEQASTLAEELGDFQLAGTARINVGMLMQHLQVQPRESN
jgi:tetratricopeptide (TPR) repeat protein